MAGLDLNQVYSQLNSATVTAENDIRTFISSAGSDGLDTAETLELQQKLQQWTLATQTQSNVIKTLSDGVKSIISNFR